MTENKNIYEDLLRYDYQTLLRESLNRVSNDVDKREGSIIYDALAPLCMMNAKIMDALYAVCIQSRFQTATGEYLDLCGSQIGIYRTPATHARWQIRTKPDNIQISTGQRFVSFDGLGLEYEVYSGSDGYYSVRCLQPGSKAGNDFGSLEPSPAIPGLESAVFFNNIDKGSDTQSDASYRDKIWRKSQKKGYGGNFHDYCEWIFYDFLEDTNGTKISGFQFYPAWQGGGTIKLSIAHDTKDGLYFPASHDIAYKLSTYLDPSHNAGQAIGAGKAPVGHHVTVTFPDSYFYELKAQVTCKHPYYIDESMKDNILRAVASYFDELRGQALTKEDSDFPFLGYSCSFIVQRLIFSILSSDSRINTVSLYSKSDGGYVECADETIVSTSSEQKLPVLKSLLVNDNMVYGG